MDFISIFIFYFLKHKKKKTQYVKHYYEISYV